MKTPTCRYRLATTTEARIARDVYGCPAGRQCVQATPQQRAGFEQQIAERLAAWPETNPETA